ncbi:MAG: tRNA-dihydrouridine synthase family protein, partial [Chitinispirillaceae bacterium]|nr:tRNA-dihydrouridine synthase family protein [Chitinispirillaceae bacterium]
HRCADLRCARHPLQGVLLLVSGVAEALSIGATAVIPPLLLAPMAGITHSALRRLVSDFGGYGALCTEMLSIPAIRSENIESSPFTKKRAGEGTVVYQLRVNGTEDLALAIDRLRRIEPAGIDINLGCPAPEVRKHGSGIELFSDSERLARVLTETRKQWHGPLTVKCRLGSRGGPWRKILANRLKLFESSGIDAITVHPRFFDEKLKRTARWDLFPWIASLTRLPIIANGDITRPDARTFALLNSGRCSGLMIGRMAVVRPWIFREFCGDTPPIDYLDVWARMSDYTLEDFPPEKAIGRIKEFTTYFSRNFKFGHDLFRLVQGAPDLATLKTRATRFLSNHPEVSKEPSVMGI